MKIRALSLAAIFKNFQNTCLTIYELGPAQFFSHQD